MNLRLDELRQQVDTIDNQLLDLLRKRISLMRKIGDVKKELHMPIRDQERENEKLTTVQNRANTLNLPQNLIRSIWKLFFEISEEIEK